MAFRDDVGGVLASQESVALGLSLRDIAHLAQNSREGANQYLQIEKKRFVDYVMNVQIDHFFEGSPVFAAGLPKAGEPGQSVTALSVSRQVPFVFVRQTWTRPDQAHFAPDDIQDLGKFVQTQSAQE